MKARSFLTAIAAVALALLLLTGGLLWGLNRRGPLQWAQQPLELNRLARFVPRQADLSLYWLGDPARLPAYVQAVVPSSRRRAAREGARRWRDGAFDLAGLDFDHELADWMGPELSLTLIDGGRGSSGPGWVLALTSRDRKGARLFLQHFWQTRSFAGTDLQVGTYRGIGLISGRAAVLGRPAQTLATALIDDDLLLLGSGRGVLEQALDVSQLDTQNQLGDQQLQGQLDRLGRGLALLTASPHALKTWLQVPAAVADRRDLAGLVAALKPHGSDLHVDGLLRFADPLTDGSWSAPVDLTPNAGGHAVWMAQLQDSARLMDPDDTHPFSQWFGPLLHASLSRQEGAAMVAAENDGPLLWLQQDEGWLLASRLGHPEADAVDAHLQETGLVSAELPGEEQKMQVWTRLQRRADQADGLDVQLALARVSDSDRNWWGRSLSAIDQRGDARSLQPRLRQWQDLSNEAVPSQTLLLSAEPAQALMARWSPWTLIQALIGQPLQSRVQGLVLAVENDQEDGDQAVLPLHARLNLG